jgi:hypothetical protein
MKAIAILFIALLVISPAVFARASSFYQTSTQLTIRRTTNTTPTLSNRSVPATNVTHYTPLSGIYGVNVVQQAPQSTSIGTFGKSWLRKSSTAVNYPPGFVQVGGIANATPGASKAPCADFGCKPSQYIVADLSTKQYYRCWCDAAKKIAPANIKCLDSPGIAKHMGFSEGKC